MKRPPVSRRTFSTTALAGRSVKIRFSVQNSDLYSFWFSQ
jgi:hypothetical protein